MWRKANALTVRWFRQLFAGGVAVLLVALLETQTPAQQATAPQPSRQALVIDIEGAIGPATADHVERVFAEVDPERVGLIVLRLDTPGGLDIAMRKIIRAELASPVPVVAYVAPSGARAASAGTYITYAASVAAMAPGTNLGAATPIAIGGLPEMPGGEPAAPDKEPEGQKKDGAKQEPKQPEQGADAETRKMVNDAVAYIRSLAQLHGRNADWAESAVRGAASLPAEEALKQGVIDLIAPTLQDLLRKIDGRTVIVAGERRTLATSDLAFSVVEMDWRTRLLSVITDPNIAYLLMLVGIYGLIFELSNPGSILPGTLGGISLLLALFAFSVLPIDYAGVALVLLGIALMISEHFVTSFGILGLGGVVSFVIGSIIMFEPGSTNFGLSISVIMGGTAVSAGFLLLALAMLLRSRRTAVVTGAAPLIGAIGSVTEWSEGEGRVRILGEVWRARAPSALRPGEHVKVRSRDGLILLVDRIESSQAKEARS
ncbi:MAG TPA: nodulation protein NfeD [Dongiaceae bacterium]|jgi:membrane-bound serine protease (ClpP class)